MLSNDAYGVRIVESDLPFRVRMGLDSEVK